MIQYLYYVVIELIFLILSVLPVFQFLKIAHSSFGNAIFNTGYIFKDVAVHTVFGDQRQQAYGFVGFVCSEFPEAN